MLRPLSQIEIIQQPMTGFPDRTDSFLFNFVHEVEVKSSWKDMTSTAKITLPRKIYFQTSTGELINWQGTEVYATQTTAPVIARGDRINIWLGYWWTTPTGQEQYLPILFQGYITKINPKIPLTFECEDMMYVLKQALCPNMTFLSTQYNTQSIVEYLLAHPIINTANTAYFNSTVLPALKSIQVVDGVGSSSSIKTNVGNFVTKNESIAQVLQRLRKDYKIETFFRNRDGNGNPGNFLYCSGIVYYPGDYINSKQQIYSTVFDFNNNIIGDTLDYLRADDVRLGIKAYSVNKSELTTTNAQGNTKTKQARLEVQIGDTDGDIRTQYFWNVPDVPTLTALARQRLPKLKYEGWRGKFNTFGLPQVQHGQAVTLVDNIIPERTGIYLVKGVTTKLGMNGFRQEIDLHLRVDGNGYILTDFMNGL